MAAPPAPATPATPARPAGAPAPTPAAPAAPGAPAPGAPAAAKPAAPPPAPAPQPTGDFAMLRDAHPADVTGYAVTEDGVGVLTVTPEGLFTVASEVKAMGYPLLSLLSAYDRGDHFGVMYSFVRLATRPEDFGELRLRVVMPKVAAGAPVEPQCASLADLFPAAEWQEREMFDMYGIRFLGNPDLRRMFLPEDWTGYPMRKDYKEPEQFVALREGEDVTVRKPEEGAW